MHWRTWLRTVVIGACSIGSSGVLAEWSRIDSGHNSTSYADLATLRRQGDIAAMRVLVDFRKAPFDGNNLSYLSLRMDAEYNCAANQYRILTLTSFRGNMATGATPYTSNEPEEWQSSASGIQKSLWRAACKNSEDRKYRANNKGRVSARPFDFDVPINKLRLDSTSVSIDIPASTFPLITCL